MGGEVVKNKPTLSVVQSRNNYSQQNLTINNNTNLQHKNNYTAYMSNQPYTASSMPNTNMSAAQNTQVSGANALDLGSVSEANQNITPDIKTNYKEIQENVKTEDPAIEDFLRDDQCLNNNNENVVFETQTLNSEKSMDQFANEENFETPQLFTGDDDIQDKEDHSHEGREDTDLSDLDFDDKDDLEIPAFLRRQTN